ncbi:unnamed protein product, partial [Ixodes persulcatus]
MTPKETRCTSATEWPRSKPLERVSIQVKPRPLESASKGQLLLIRSRRSLAWLRLAVSCPTSRRWCLSDTRLSSARRWVQKRNRALPCEPTFFDACINWKMSG